VKTRTEVVAYINEHWDKDDLPPIPQRIQSYNKWRADPSIKGAWHYGKSDLRNLLDFIYEGPPTDEKENLTWPS
jgi:hypothetical protein